MMSPRMVGRIADAMRPSAEASSLSPAQRSLTPTLLVGVSEGNADVDSDSVDDAGREVNSVIDHDVNVASEVVIVVTGTEVVKVVGMPAVGVGVVGGVNIVVGIAEEV